MVRTRSLLLAVAAALLIARPAAAQLDVTLTKVADRTTPAPDGSGPFEYFLGPAVVEDGVVVFRGRGATDGLYRWEGGALSVVVDEFTPLPGGAGNVVNPTDTSLSGGDVAFRSQFSGLYVESAGSLELVANGATPIPGGTGDFTTVYRPSLDGGVVAFRGLGGPNAAQDGVYLDNGLSLERVADKSTVPPGNGASFIEFWDPDVDGGEVAYTVRQSGVFLYDGTSTVVVADVDTAFPGGTGTFDGFIGVVLDQGELAVLGTQGVQSGIYTTLGGSFRRVADTTTPIPEAPGSFFNFSPPSLDGGSVAFRGTATGSVGVYVELEGTLHKVIDDGDTLDGKTVRFFSFDREGLSGSQLVFTVFFDDDTDGVYLASFSLPEPVPALAPNLVALTALAMGVVAGVALLRRRTFTRSFGSHHEM